MAKIRDLVVIGGGAGELVHELALAVQENMKISKLTSLVNACPTYSQLNKRLAGQYYKDRLFNPLKKSGGFAEPLFILSKKL